MTDRPSSSEELLGQARGATDADAAGYEPESPVDDYVLPTTFDTASVAPDVDLDLDVDNLSAAEIAAALLESQGIDPDPETDLEPDPEPADSTVIDEPTDEGTRSLPTWATEPASTVPTAPATPADPAPSANTESEPAGAAPPTTPTSITGGFGGDGVSWDQPTDEWLEYEARQKAKQASRAATFPIPVPRIRTLVAFAVFGFFAFGLLYGLVDGKDPIESARVGDCFVAGDAIEIDQVAIVECTEEHDSEVFAIVNAEPVFGATYPGEDALFSWLFDECLENFSGYTGESYETSRYYFDTLIPTSDAWRFGDHEGMCTLILLDSDDNLLISTSSGRRDAAATNNA